MRFLAILLILGVAAVGQATGAAAQSDRVRMVQEQLEARGFNPGPVDGLMGQKTRLAIRHFQERMGLPPTGDLDQATMSGLAEPRQPEVESPVGPSAISRSTSRSRTDAKPALPPQKQNSGREIDKPESAEATEDAQNGIVRRPLPSPAAASTEGQIPASATKHSAPAERPIANYQTGVRWTLYGALVIGLLMWWRSRRKHATRGAPEENDLGKSIALPALASPDSSGRNTDGSLEIAIGRLLQAEMPTYVQSGSSSVKPAPPSSLERNGQTANIGYAKTPGHGSSFPTDESSQYAAQEISRATSDARSGLSVKKPHPRSSADTHNKKVAEFIRRRAERGEGPIADDPETESTLQPLLSPSNGPSKTPYGSSGIVFGKRGTASGTSEVSDGNERRPGFANSAAHAVRWVRPDQTVQVAGRNLGGMLYVGTPQRHEQPDNALIDPTKPVAAHGDDLQGAGMPYWPNYSSIDARSRATYLSWLERGRSDANYDVGYVFLYFYGLERRFFIDRPDEAEQRTILSEAERLLSAYAANGSIRRYLGQFVEMARLVMPGGLAVEPSYERTGYEMPLSVRLAIGSMVAEGKPVPAEWMLSWLMTHPEVYLRTPARRAFPEFKELFQLRFTRRFPEGLKVAIPKRKLVFSYRAASGNFERTLSSQSGSVADISGLSKPATIAREIAEAATDDLDGFSRYLGRNPDGRGTIEAHALLPEPLKDLFPCPELDGLRSWVDQKIGDGGLVPVADLIEKIHGFRPDKATKVSIVRLAEALAAMSVGLAPDPRFALRAPKIGEPVKLFRLPDAAEGLWEVGAAYRSMLLSIFVGSFIAHADGSISNRERRDLENVILEADELTRSEAVRLQANLDWLLAVPPDLSLLRRNARQASETARREFARIALSTAGADGRIHPKEVDALRKLYAIVGLDPEGIYADLHALMADSEPVTVMKPSRRPTEYAIPKRPGNEGPNTAKALDRDKIAAIVADTARVSNVLHEIFSDDEDDGMETSDVEEKADASRFSGLDAKHRTLVQELLREPVWKPESFERLAAQFGLLPAGSLETINEWAFERFNEPLIEETDGLEVNPEVKMQLLS